MTTCRWFVWVGVLLLAAPAFAQSAAERIDATRQLVAGGKFKEALPELDALIKLPNNDRATVAAFYELSGLAWGGLKQAAKARVAFQKLLVLEPTFKLTGKVPPKTAAFFKDAKRAVTQAGGGGLKAEQLTPEVKGSVVAAVYASVENDLASLTQVVRWHLKIDGGKWTVKEVPAQPTTIAEAGGKVVQWWLELVGENGAVLATLGSEAAPIVDAVPGAAPKPAVAKKDEPKKVEPKQDAPVLEPKASLTPVAKVEPAPELVAPATPLKAPGGLSIVLAGAGVASAGAGAVFGVLSTNARNQVTNATVDPGTGYVTGLTRSEALKFEQQAQTNAVVANTLIGVGAGLVVGGVVAWLAGGK